MVVSRGVGVIMIVASAVIVAIIGGALGSGFASLRAA